jgi:glyoxylase-like metal-dependent hydrolase (beta-lactamase superfamily II)
VYFGGGFQDKGDEAMSIASSTATIVLDRRKFLAAATGLVASGLLPRRALALAAPATFTQGAFEVTVVSDGHLVLPASVLWPSAPPEELKALLATVGVTGDEVQPAANITLIKAGSDLILFDNGSGTEFQPTAGKLLENLAAAGIDPGSITKMVFTHAHPDHVWATVNGAGGLNFPNAAYYCGASEWNFWMGKDILAQTPEEMHPFVLGAQKHLKGAEPRITLVKPGDEIVSGIRVLDTAGHTPGHVSFEVEGDGGLIVVGDVAGLPAVVFPHPEWPLGFDAIPDLAVTNRKALLQRAAADKIKMIGFHWPYPGVGFAEAKDSGFEYVPAM